MKLSTASLTKTCRLLSEQFRGLKLKQSTRGSWKQTNKQTTTVNQNKCSYRWWHKWYVELLMWCVGGVGVINKNNEILIKREPLVYQSSARCTKEKKKKKKKKGEDNTTAIASSSLDNTPADTTYISLTLSLSLPLSHTHTHKHTHTRTHTTASQMT